MTAPRPAAEVMWDAIDDKGIRGRLSREDCGYLAAMLAAEGYPTTPEALAEWRTIVVHHHDIEKHAEHFNEGYETAVAQGLANDPALAQDWLSEHDAQLLRDAVATLRSEFTRERSRQVGFGDPHDLTEDILAALSRIASGGAP